MIHSGAWRPTCVAVAIILGWVASASAQPELRVRGKGQKYALLVGVDRYGKGTLLPGLAYPQRDVEGLAAVLLDSGLRPGRPGRDDPHQRRSKTSTCCRPPATSATSSRCCSSSLKPGDSILVMLAGHGVMMEAPPPGGGQARAAKLLLPDGRRPPGAGPHEADRLRRVLRRPRPEPGDDQAAVDRRLPQRAEGRAAGGAAPGIAMPPPPPPPPSVAALYACSEKEVSWEDSGLGGGHGVFSHFVIEGLQGAADARPGRHVHSGRAERVRPGERLPVRPDPPRRLAGAPPAGQRRPGRAPRPFRRRPGGRAHHDPPGGDQAEADPGGRVPDGVVEGRGQGRL